MFLNRNLQGTQELQEARELLISCRGDRSSPEVFPVDEKIAWQVRQHRKLQVHARHTGWVPCPGKG